MLSTVQRAVRARFRMHPAPGGHPVTYDDTGADIATGSAFLISLPFILTFVFWLVCAIVAAAIDADLGAGSSLMFFSRAARHHDPATGYARRTG
jgi:hypothetical protein